jgi:hypothetical protein
MQHYLIELVEPFDRTHHEQTCELPHSSRCREGETQFSMPRPFDLLLILTQSATIIETAMLTYANEVILGPNGYIKVKPEAEYTPLQLESAIGKMGSLSNTFQRLPTQQWRNQR